MNTLNTQRIKTISEQRENLLILNPDLVYGVYKLHQQDWSKIVVENQENILTTYENQLPNLKGILENSDIILLDLGELRKGKFKPLNNKNLENFAGDFVLLSNGVIEVISAQYKDKNGDIQERNHFPTMLRDGGVIDQNQRTSVAGRNVTSNLFEDLGREYSEENPFIGKGRDEKWTLFTPQSENSAQSKKDLIESVKNFLKNKYNLDRENPEHRKSIKIMERSLKIAYEDLGKILEEIIQNERIGFFENGHLNDFEGISNDMKEVEMIDDNGNALSKWNFFVFFDKENNTIEYRALRKIAVPEWVRPTARLYLESQNQGVKNSRPDNLSREKLVPTIRYFVEKILTK